MSGQKKDIGEFSKNKKKDIGVNRVNEKYHKYNRTIKSEKRSSTEEMMGKSGSLEAKGACLV
jgi:hypothetical protein